MQSIKPDAPYFMRSYLPIFSQNHQTVAAKRDVNLYERMALTLVFT